MQNDIMFGMKHLTPFARKVLEFAEPDEARRQEILEPQNLAPASTSEDMMKFRERIMRAVSNKEKIMIAGDYDADGILSTTIMVSGLRSLGLEVGFYIPNRMSEGYGLKPHIVEMVKEKGYSLIITVDNGIRALPALEKAKELGVDVIVTDHHSYEERPEVLALVHPSTMEPVFSTLCGAGVAFECMRAIGADTPEHLMYAAVASIADCMEVFHETRAIIRLGLELLNSWGEMHINLLCRSRDITEDTVSFDIAPRINCIGRLADQINPNSMVRYFLNHNEARVRDFAQTIEKTNNERKHLTEQVKARANLNLKLTRPVLVTADPDFHEGIVGLAAGNICSQTGKPVIIGAHGKEGVKCSMRAPEGFNCMNFLSGYEHFIACGGHALAAGFTVPFEKWEEFEAYCMHKGLEMNFTYERKDCMVIDPAEASVENIESLAMLRPFGTGFEMPSFEIDHPSVRNVFDMSEGKHRKYTVDGGLQCINFHQTSYEKAINPNTIEKMIGRLGINEYRGSKSSNFYIDELIGPAG